MNYWGGGAYTCFIRRKQKSAQHVARPCEACHSADLRGLMNAIGCSFPDMPARMHFLMDSDQTVHLRSLISAINVRI